MPLSAFWLQKRDNYKRLLLTLVCYHRHLSSHTSLTVTVVENRRRKEEKLREAEALSRRIAEEQQYERQQATERRARNVQHGRDLQGQMDYNRQLQQQHRSEEEREYLMGQQAEQEYRDRVKYCLDNAIFPRLHPLRRAFLANGSTVLPEM